ncbi:hypothetical protein L4C37_07540, partial [Vibrio kagoshimensis]|uniref:hypothetical protein n=1 Tax=Vibrio kagoshimensis TaxID=2910244 RepID=UPI003D1D1230
IKLIKALIIRVRIKLIIRSLSRNVLCVELKKSLYWFLNINIMPPSIASLMSDMGIAATEYNCGIRFS